jgi:hypothetical protein
MGFESSSYFDEIELWVLSLVAAGIDLYVILMK